MDKQLDSVIRYHERIAQRAKIIETPAIQALEELTVSYLQKLREIRVKEVK